MFITRWIKTMRMRLQHWQDVSRGRRELRQLSDYLLKDIGISRADAEREADRPFWDDRTPEDMTLKRYQVETAEVSRQQPDCCRA